MLAGLVWLALALPAAADRLPLAEISRYLGSFETARSPFTQVNADGTISTGTILMHRPGRVRFEYDPPDESVVLASGGRVAIFDGKSNTAPDEFPLNRTPLSIILDRTVDLGRRDMVVGHESDGKTTSVVAQDPEHPDQGNIRLVFTGDPVELRQWVITDETGAQTTVILGALETGVATRPSQFSIIRELERRGLRE